MTREIKFRAWSEKEKAWCGAFSIHMSGLFSEMINAKIVEPQHMAVADAHWQDLSKENPYKITVMQFTGLKDKNGKEIYEGDIVATGKERFIQTVHFGVSGVKFNEPKVNKAIGGRWSNYDEVGEFEVIGNIYENKELLTPQEIG